MEQSGINKIGLLVKGNKDGLKTFFSDSLDREDPEVSAIENMDLRNLVSFDRVNVNYYSIAFTSKYKVFAQYRTLLDTTSSHRSGGAVYIILFIPHGLEITVSEGYVRLLGELVDCYWKNYVTQMGTQVYIDLDRCGRKENAGLFRDIIASYGFRENKVRPLCIGKEATKTIAKVIYKDKELNSYFTDPYWIQYVDYKYIFLLSENILKKFESVPELDIPVHDRYFLNIQVPEKCSCSVILNGQPLYINDLESYRCSDDVVLDLTVERNGYRRRNYKGTLRDLIAQNGWLKGNGKLKIQMPPLAPETVSIQLVFEGRGMDPVKYSIQTEEGEKRIASSPEQNIYSFIGEEISKNYRFLLETDSYGLDGFAGRRELSFSPGGITDGRFVIKLISTKKKSPSPVPEREVTAIQKSGRSVSASQRQEPETDTEYRLLEMRYKNLEERSRLDVERIKKKYSPIIGGLVVLLLIAIGLGWMYYSASGKNNDLKGSNLEAQIDSLTEQNQDLKKQIESLTKQLKEVLKVGESETGGQNTEGSQPGNVVSSSNGDGGQSYTVSKQQSPKPSVVSQDSVSQKEWNEFSMWNCLSGLSYAKAQLDSIKTFLNHQDNGKIYDMGGGKWREKQILDGIDALEKGINPANFENPGVWQKIYKSNFLNDKFFTDEQRCFFKIQLMNKEACAIYKELINKSKKIDLQEYQKALKNSKEYKDIIDVAKKRNLDNWVNWLRK